MLWNSRSAILFLIVLTGCGKNSQQLITRGNEFLAKGEWQEAQLNFRKAIQKDPKSGEAYRQLGLAEEKLNHGTEAFAALNQAIKLMPNDRKAKVELAGLVLPAYVGDPRHPQVFYDTLTALSADLIKADPLSVDGLRVKGFLSLHDRHLPEATDLFRKALGVNPKDTDSALGLIQSLSQSNQVLEAEQAGLTFLQKSPSAAIVYDAMYGLYSGAGRPADAEAILIRKSENSADRQSALLQLAGYYSRARRLSEMNATLQRILDHPSDFSKGRLGVGDFYGALSNWPKAVEQYQAGLSADPHDQLVYQMRIANALVAEKKPPEALKMLDGIVKQHPESQEAQALRAVLLVADAALAKREEGLRQLQAVLEKKPADSLLRFALARALVQKGDLEKARVQLSEIERLNPDFLPAQIALAEISYQQNRQEEVITRAAKILERDPGNMAAKMLRASALNGLGRLGESRLALNQLAQEGPPDADLHLQLGLIDLKQKKYSEAEVEFKKAHEVSPADIRALSGLVDTYNGQKQPEKALAMLTQVAARSGASAEVHQLLAASALRAGKLDVAAAQYQILVAANPSGIAPLLDLAQTQRLMGEPEKAIGTLRKAQEIDAKDPRSVALLAPLLSGSNQKEEAIVQARRALALKPGEPMIQNNLAFFLAEKGTNLEEALSLAQLAVDKSPKDLAYLDTLGYVHLRKKNTDDAVQIFSKLARQDPANAMFGYHLALALFEKGNKSGAKAELERALQQRPSKETENTIRDLLSRIS
jgi:tetratricopeptide (TPR) repeat protein